jgi:hypothetical protein
MKRQHSAQHPAMSRSASPSAKARRHLAGSRILEKLESRMLLSVVPAPLQSIDIGTPTGGSASFNSGTSVFTVTGAGSDLFGANDAFHFVDEPLNGPGTITVEVTGSTANGGHSLAGLDIRSSTAANAANLFVATRDDGTVFVNSRTQTGEAGVANNFGVAGSFPEFLKLTLNNQNEVIASYSTNGGANYTQVADTFIGFPGNKVVVGLAVASQTAPTTLATATFSNFSVVPSSTTVSQTLSATNLVGTQLAPYQFTVAYNAATDINASTIAASNVTVTAPNATTPTVTLVSTGLTNGTTLTATYEIPTPTQFGNYTIASNGQVGDFIGDTVATAALGSFIMTADVTPPVATLSSAPAAFTGGAAPYEFTFHYTDNGLIRASTIDNSNVSVQLPDGSSEAATLVSTGLASASTETVIYSIPAPTEAGTYTIKEGSIPLSDASGNQIAAGTIGTFTAAVANSISGTVFNTALAGESGVTVFVDTNGNGILLNVEESTTTNSAGAFVLGGLPTGSYKIAEVVPAGQQLLAPSGGDQDVTVTGGQVLTGVNFVNTVANTSGSTINLVGSFRNKFASVKVGAAASASVRITNNGTTTAAGFVNVELLLTTDGTAATSVATLRTVRVKSNLKKGKFAAVPVSYKYPAGTTPGTYKVVAIVDSSNAIAETSKLDNVFSSTPITLQAAKKKG